MQAKKAQASSMAATPRRVPCGRIEDRRLEILKKKWLQRPLDGRE
jgi:hypothetical protein